MAPEILDRLSLWLARRFVDVPDRDLQPVVDALSEVFVRARRDGFEDLLPVPYLLPQIHRFAVDLWLVLRCLDGAPRRRVADLGCGAALVSLALHFLGHEVVPVDMPWVYDPYYFDRREAYLGRFGLRVLRADLLNDRLPIDDDSLDVVTCNDVVEHLQGPPKRLMSEVLRVLRPGGRTAWSTPNSVSLRHRLAVPFGASNYAHMPEFYETPLPYFGHVREYTPSELAWALERAGMEVREIRRFNNFFKDVFRQDGTGRLLPVPYRPHGPADCLRPIQWALTSTVFPAAADSFGVIASKRTR